MGARAAYLFLQRGLPFCSPYIPESCLSSRAFRVLRCRADPGLGAELSDTRLLRRLGLGHAGETRRASAKAAAMRRMGTSDVTESAIAEPSTTPARTEPCIRFRNVLRDIACAAALCARRYAEATVSSMRRRKVLVRA